MSSIKAKIEGHSKFGIKLGLDNISAVLNKLDNPQDKLDIIHIAGTNGKGSVSSMVSSSLQAEGYLVAKYCSPYLINFNEMFMINDQQIDDQQLEQYYQQLITASLSIGIELTLYEITTAIMFMYAEDSKVDFLVLEVGLGGRLDATNIVKPKVTAITNISLDHTQILGDTIEEIATEKAGIIKPGVPLFTTECNQVARNIFLAKADKLIEVDFNLDYSLNYETFQTNVLYQSQEYAVNLFGSHQVQNFALAISILKYLKISEDGIKIGMANVVHPARLEKLSAKILFDGAHNPASAAALVESLKDYPKPINVIFSILKDKDIKAVVTILSQLSNNLKFVPLSTFDRGLSSEEFKELQLPKVQIVNNIEQALEDDKLNLICGTFSLYPLTKVYLERL